MGNSVVSARSEQVEILRNAIEMEIDGREFFSEMAERVKHTGTKDMYMALARQEDRHIEVLEEQLKRLESGSDWTSPSAVKRSREAVPKVSVFGPRERAGYKIDPKAGELEAVQFGMEIEKRSIEYYRKAGSEVKGAKAKEVFNWLVGEEAGHLTILRAEYDNRSRSGFYFDVPEFSLEVM